MGGIGNGEASPYGVDRSPAGTNTARMPFPVNRNHLIASVAKPNAGAKP